VELLLALDQSRKAHEEEERKRRAQREAQQKASRQENVSEPPHHSASMSEHYPQTRPQEQSLPLAQNSHAASGQLRTVGNNQRTADVVASQETDYGDLELDVMDLLDLEMGTLPQ
jgi:sRNA-binding protein